MTPSDSPPPPSATDPSVPEALEGLIARAVSADGRSPFSQTALADLAAGTRRLIWAADAAALVSATEAEFVVDPDYRRRGQGGRMLNLLLTGTAGDLFLWAHGGHPDAIALAASRGLQPVREVLHLRSAVDATSLASENPVSGPHGAVSLHFSVISEGVAAEVAALEALAFGEERALVPPPGTRPEDFLLLWDGGMLAGLCWLTADGEFGGVGVDPARRGEGLGRMLVEAGLARLAERGIRDARLQVDGDNTAALRLFRRFGFRQHSIDIRYRWRSQTSDPS